MSDNPFQAEPTPEQPQLEVRAASIWFIIAPPVFFFLFLGMAHFGVDRTNFGRISSFIVMDMIFNTFVFAIAALLLIANFLPNTSPGPQPRIFRMRKQLVWLIASCILTNIIGLGVCLSSYKPY